MGLKDQSPGVGGRWTGSKENEEAWLLDFPTTNPVDGKDLPASSVTSRIREVSSKDGDQVPSINT